MYELCDIEELAYDATHSLDVMPQRLDCSLIRLRVKPRPQDGQRCPEFVRGIGGKLPLNAKAVLETIKCLIYRLQKVANFGWHLTRRQTNIGMHRTNSLCLFRRV